MGMFSGKPKVKHNPRITREIDALQSVRVSKKELERIREVGYTAWSHETGREM